MTIDAKSCQSCGSPGTDVWADGVLCDNCFVLIDDEDQEPGWVDDARSDPDLLGYLRAGDGFGED